MKPTTSSDRPHARPKVADIVTYDLIPSYMPGVYYGDLMPGKPASTKAKVTNRAETVVTNCVRPI
jgi:hypothetical protein